MRIIICGSREFNDYPLLRDTMDRLTAKLDKSKLTCIVNRARGMGAQWCFERLLRYEIFYPDYDQYGKKKAPLICNTEMVKADPDSLVAFWDGAEEGQMSDLVTKAKYAGLKIRIIETTK